MPAPRPQNTARNPGAAARLFDAMVAAISPATGIKRMAAREALAYYEAAKPAKQRKFRSSSGAPDTAVAMGAAAMRNQVRYLERNHDLARGCISTLVHNTVGPNGIGVEFQPRRLDGTIHTEYAALLAEAWRDWTRRPEVTWQHHWPAAQRMAARTWVRDGEALAQRIMGNNATLQHGTRVPYSLELIEPDLLPFDFDEAARNIGQGIECNQWGRPTAFHLYKGHPEGVGILQHSNSLKRIPADRMLHLALRDRIGQRRGVTAFASVITRLEDIKDYEESERIAAKVAAMMTAYVKRGQATDYEPSDEVGPDGNPLPRDLRLQPGTIIDTLAVGEEVGLIDTNRPNPNLVHFRDGQLRALASGITASYSSVSRNYNGTYSAQRQELVEQWVHYAVMTDMFTSGWVRPVVEDFIMAADLSGVAPMPADLKPGTHDDVLYVAPAMPWIDPLKEITAWAAAVENGFASEVETIRRRGAKPDDVLAQIKEWRLKVQQSGVQFGPPATTAAAAANPANN